MLPINYRCRALSFFSVQNSHLKGDHVLHVNLEEHAMLQSLFSGAWLIERLTFRSTMQKGHAWRTSQASHELTGMLARVVMDCLRLQVYGRMHAWQAHCSFLNVMGELFVTVALHCI